MKLSKLGNGFVAISANVSGLAVSSGIDPQMFN